MKGLPLSGGGPFYFREVNYENEAIMPVTIPCAICGDPIKICPSHVPRRATCSKPCRISWQRKFEIEPDDLLLTVWTEPVTRVAASFDVSDKAIEKRCKRLSVPKPPRGYWAKIQNGVPHKEALFELGWLREEIEELGERLAAAEESVHVQEAVPIPG
jgi:hypothetical protein